ncbi:hypothetical protein AB5J52_48005 (plasmid) [Streptomyces sp. R39]|uniref:Uncharacterized protein n=1 Tax=Streptomyces sp. R39 TaxID=3238631 RepID=A0AB39R6C6_9ACTN
MATDHDPNTTPQPSAPGAPQKATRRRSAQEVIQLVIHEKQLADVDVEIDFEALARLDDMPDDEAVALINETMFRIMFD